MPEQLKQSLREGAEDAVKFWRELVLDSAARPADRNKAAENLCAYAYGKPVQAIDVEERGMVTHVDTDKLTPDAREAILQMVAASVNPEADS